MSSGPVSDRESDSEDLFSKRKQAIFSKDNDKMAADQKEESDNDEFSNSDLLNLVVLMWDKLKSERKKRERSTSRVRSPSPLDSEHDEAEETSSSEQHEEAEALDKSDSDEDPFVNYHDKHKKKPDVGPEVAEKLGELVTALLTEKQNHDEMEEKVGKILRPENIPMLQVQKVTDKLWRNLPNSVRSQDVAFQGLSEWLLKVLTLVTESADMLDSVRRKADKETRAELKPVTNKLLDCLQVR